MLITNGTESLIGGSEDLANVFELRVVSYDGLMARPSTCQAEILQKSSSETWLLCFLKLTALFLNLVTCEIGLCKSLALLPRA